jgi:hypothetical protein
MINLEVPMSGKKFHIRFLFALILSAVFLFNITHELLHSVLEHGTETHTTCHIEDEADDCHRFIVHHIKSEQCDGDHDHFSEAGEKCFKCEFFKEKQKYGVTDAARFGEFVNQNSYVIGVPASKAVIDLFSRFLRGPPPVI